MLSLSNCSWFIALALWSYITIIFVTQIIKRYESEFGARNFKLTIGEVDFIAIDSQTLDGNSPHHSFDHLLATANSSKTILLILSSSFLIQNWFLLVLINLYIYIDSFVFICFISISAGHPQGNFTLDTWGFIENVSKGIKKRFKLYASFMFREYAPFTLYKIL